MNRSRDDSQMKCPGCGKFTLKREDGHVLCKFCGHILTPGEETRFRLYELLKEQG